MTTEPEGIVVFVLDTPFPTSEQPPDLIGWLTESAACPACTVAALFDIDAASAHRAFAIFGGLEVDGSGYARADSLVVTDDDAGKFDTRPGACWRCDAAAATTELGLCASCDDDLREPEPEWRGQEPYLVIFDEAVGFDA